MWQYQNTDELYHSNMYKNVNKVSNKELYHSDVYLGKDFSDGIKHWKYIKREKVNGKWRYYYKNDKLDQLGREKKDAADALREENRLRGYGNDTFTNSKDKSKSYKLVDDNLFKKSIAYATEEYKNRNKKDKYERLLIKPLNKVSDKIYNGKQKIKNILSKINKKYKIVSTHHERTITRNRPKKI